MLCGVCPRRDCDVSELNEIIYELGQHHECLVVNMDTYFLGKDQSPTLRYYSKDQIHLSKSGIRRFLDAIEKSCAMSIVKSFDMCVFGYQSSPKLNAIKSYGPSSRYSKRNGYTTCTKCGESNHSTFECRHLERIQCHQCGFSDIRR